MCARVSVRSAVDTELVKRKKEKSDERASEQRYFWKREERESERNNFASDDRLQREDRERGEEKNEQTQKRKGN